MDILIYFILAALSIIVLALAVVVFALARQVGVLFERVSPIGAMINDSGPKVGEAAPFFTLPSLTGGEVYIGGAHPQARSSLIFFLSPTCPICKKLLPVLKSIRASEKMDVILASDGDVARHQAFIGSADLNGLPYVVSQDLGVVYRVSKLPFAVLIDHEGTVKSKGLINSREQLESLFAAAETGFASIQDLARAMQPA
ncbi:hypothetical protein AGMMS50225_00270 [Betaproteobacteria bacterium]|nr:hypothetical protein AGMMS50225_00270 [Betaproteobacteria bacterium]